MKIGKINIGYKKHTHSIFIFLTMHAWIANHGMLLGASKCSRCIQFHEVVFYGSFSGHASQSGVERRWALENSNKENSNKLTFEKEANILLIKFENASEIARRNKWGIIYGCFHYKIVSFSNLWTTLVQMLVHIFYIFDNGTSKMNDKAINLIFL